MVRTVICNPLIDKEVFQDVYKPTAVCSSRDGYIFLANAKNTINVHNIHDNTFPLIKILQTTSMPIKLVYSERGGFLLSLEKHNSNKVGTSSLTSARAYLYWKSEPNSDSLRSRPNGYSSIGQYLSSYVGRHLIIDLPSKGGVQDASVCQSNANIVIAISGKINIYAYKEVQGKDLIDFYHFISVETDMSIVAISLFSTYMLVASSDEMIVFNFEFNYRSDDMTVQEGEEIVEIMGDSLSMCSQSLSISEEQTECGTSSEESPCFIWNISSGQGYMSKALPNLNHSQSKYKDVDSKGLKFKTVEEEPPFQQASLRTGDMIGPLECLPGHNITISIIDELYWFGQLQCRFTVGYSVLVCKALNHSKRNKLQPTEGATVHSLLWAPTFIPDNETVPGLSTTFEDTTFDVHHPLAIDSDFQLLDLCCFFSTLTKGYLYNLLNETPSCITVYPYSDKCYSALISKGLLHTLTSTGVETYTTRVYASASNSRKLEEVKNADKNFMTAYRTASLVSYPGQLFDGSSSPRNVLPVKDFHYGTPLDSAVEQSAKPQDKDTKSKSNVETDQSNESIVSYLTRNSYSIEEMMQVCPSEQTSICLIGVKNLPKCQVLCQTSSKVIVIKPADPNSQKGLKERRRSAHADNKAVFSCCVFSKESEINLYKKMIDLIKGSEFASPPVYNLLLSEGHMLLRSAACISCNHEQLDSYIKDSASKIGSFLARCKQSFKWRDIQSYFSLAGLTLTQVLDRLMRKDKEEQSSERYGPGIIHYLNGHLKQSEDVSMLSEAQSNHILHIFSITEPSSLSSVLLDSNLANYSIEFAIKLILSFRKSEDENSRYILKPIDHVTVAVLHLRLCNPDQAESSLMRLKTKELLEICVEYHHLFLNTELELTPIGQLVRRYMPDILSEMFVKLIENQTVDLFEAVKVFKTEEASPNSGVCDMLETLLTNKSRQEMFYDAVSILVKQYFTNFKHGIFNDGIKVPHPHLAQSNGHFGLRFEWLNKLPPFNGESPKNQDCSNRKKFQSNQSISTIEHSPQGVQKEKEICGCCCCNRFLIKLQSLLCSTYNNATLSHVIIDCITNEVDFPGIDSIRLLTWPYTNQVQLAVDYLIQSSPDLLLGYARSVFTTNEAMWNVLLQSLLRNLRSSSCKEWYRETYTLALRGTLSRLSSLCLPNDFLQLLPGDGSLGFFIEFLEDCCRGEKALLTKRNFITTNAEFMSS